MASAYFGGRFDLIFQRVMDVLMAFPLIILALAVVAIFGTGTHNVIIAITIPFIPRCARVVRSSALAVREMPYVDAARACGFGHARIVLRHMVPNVMAPYLIVMTAFVGQAILLEASLSYLGLGVQEPVPAWGLMLRGGNPRAAGRRAGVRRARPVSPRESPSASPCSASACSATRCATSSIEAARVSAAQPAFAILTRSRPQRDDSRSSSHPLQSCSTEDRPSRPRSDSSCRTA